MRFYSALAISIALPLVATVARADDQARIKANEYFRLGGTEYKLGNFNKALDYFKKTFQLVDSPSVILNMGQCYRQLNQPEKALFNYKLYLSEWKSRNPDKEAPFFTEVQGHIKTVKAALKSTQEKKEKDKRHVPLYDKDATANAVPEATIPVYKKWWLWTIVGAVVVAGAVTVTAIATAPEGVRAPTGTMPPGTVQFD
jgi:tetratricopeptide (TPR) repeat protein